MIVPELSLKQSCLFGKTIGSCDDEPVRFINSSRIMKTIVVFCPDGFKSLESCFFKAIESGFSGLFEKAMVPIDCIILLLMLSLSALSRLIDSRPLNWLEVRASDILSFSEARSIDLRSGFYSRVTIVDIVISSFLRPDFSVALSKVGLRADQH